MDSPDLPDLLDRLVREAVTAIDAGDVTTLERLMAEHPRLLRDRLDAPGAWLRDKVGGALEGFFQKPYLLWFVAEDPVRNGQLPRNIAQVTRAIIEASQREGVATLQEQLDYALRLVSSSWIARTCGVQIELIDALVDAGASPDGNPDNALVNGNFAAAEHLVEHGATLTLATALCLGRWDAVTRLAPTTSARDKQFGFVLAALNGQAEALRRMIDLGIDLNNPSADLYSHATPLHHAVCSGSLEAVRVLVDAGANMSTRDTAWNGTPLGWAEYYEGEHARDERGQQYAEIAAYLRATGGH
ncbi:MAG: ankyrin repeat domain-containing protein [Gemmatimonadales bacterium]